MPTLRDHLRQLADRFAAAVLAAIRSASVEDLLSEGTRAPFRRRSALTDRAATAIVDGAPRAKVRRGRLARRSAADIERALASVVAAVKSSKSGLRAEEIRAKLGLDRRELPRVLAMGLATKKLRSKGQRRGTRYFAR